MEDDLNMTFNQSFKIKLLLSSYVHPEAIQLLSETFFSTIKIRKLFGGH